MSLGGSPEIEEMCSKYLSYVLLSTTGNNKFPGGLAVSAKINSRDSYQK